MSEARFETEVTQADARAFADLSGDWNPLHTDADYAARTVYGRPVLHGAFAGGLISRLAGMHLPGRNCLLHSIRLNFIAPIQTPVRLVVSGREATPGDGRVDATISDAETGVRYVDATYEYALHAESADTPAPAQERRTDTGTTTPILVTGATGGVGRAVLAQLGDRGLGVSRQAGPGIIQADSASAIAAALGDRKISGIVHCAWPRPDNQDLLSLDAPAAAIDHHLARPLDDILALGRLMRDQGAPDAMLLLVGSTFAEPGRHGWRMPLYSLAKGLLPSLARICALELAPAGMRCATVVFDVLDGGMNDGLSAAALQGHADRMPSGNLPDGTEAAAQIIWMLDNRSALLSGATITLSGGALP